MADKQTILEGLTEFVTRNFMVDREDINFDESLIDQGVIDSFGLVEITAYIQTNHGITVQEEEMTREQFGSMNKMARYITLKLEERENADL